MKRFQSNTTAHHELVNRTQRIVRQRAAVMQQSRDRARGLFAPLTICSVLMAAIFIAAWQVMAEYDLTPTGVPDAKYQVMFLMLWCVPVAAVVVGMIWFQHDRKRGGDEVR